MAESLRDVAEKSGVGYSWLVKFSGGLITNPTISNVSKLETYFESVDKSV